MNNDPWAIFVRRIGSQSHPQKIALDLLFEFLTPEQQEEYLETDTFTFTAKSGRWYRIGKPLLWELDQEGRVKTSFCVHPQPDDLPKPEKDLNILLWLMANESKVRTMAWSYIGLPGVHLLPEELHRVSYRALDELFPEGHWGFLTFPVRVAAVLATPFRLVWKLLRAWFTSRI